MSCVCPHCGHSLSCRSCGKRIDPRNTGGLCKSCCVARINSDSDIVARKVAAGSLNRLRHVPADKRSEYLHLTKTKRIPAAEALQMVMA